MVYLWLTYKIVIIAYKFSISEYENATTLNLVGLQIWRGAFLLSDFVVHNYLTFQGKNIVELGSGTGLVGIVGSLFAENVVLTGEF